MSGLQCSEAGGVWWERHVRSVVLMDWNTVTLKTFDPGPPKTSFLWKECGCVSPPPPFFSSLPSRPLSHEPVRRQALSLLCSHARLCVAGNLISICTLCSIHVLSMLLRADRTAMASQLMNVWCSSSNTPIRLDLVLLVSSRFHLSESPSCAIYTTISLLAGKNKKHTHDHDHDTSKPLLGLKNPITTNLMITPGILQGPNMTMLIHKCFVDACFLLDSMYAYTVSIFGCIASVPCLSFFASAYTRLRKILLFSLYLTNACPAMPPFSSSPRKNFFFFNSCLDHIEFA